MNALRLAMLILIVMLPLGLTWKGIGSRRIWFGGALGSLIIFLFMHLHNTRNHVMQWGKPGGDVIAFGDGPQYGPPPWDVLVQAWLILATFMFLLAGLLFRPKKQPSTSLLGNHEGRNPNAGRANGENQGH
jgi:hypothetical protein